MRNSEVCRSGRKWKVPVFQIYVDLFLAGFTPQILYFHSFWNDSICKAYHTWELTHFYVYSSHHLLHKGHFFSLPVAQLHPMHEVHGLNIGFSLSQSGKIKRAKIYPKLGKLKEKKNNKTQLQCTWQIQKFTTQHNQTHDQNTPKKTEEKGHLPCGLELHFLKY